MERGRIQGGGGGLPAESQDKRLPKGRPGAPPEGRFRAPTPAKQSPEGRGLDVLSTGQTVRLTVAAPRLRSRKGPFLVDQTKLGALQAQALAQGGLVYSPWDDQHRRAAWLICGKGRDRCIAPVMIVLQSGEDEATHAGSAIELHARCRKCEPCRKAKSAFWKLRAMAEIGKAARTWFVTLTWRPEDRLRAMYAADQALARAGNVAPTEADLFGARLATLQPAVTLWLQRLRKGLRTEGEDTVAFRYLLVWEAHKDGFPHAHLLIHETAGQTVSKRRVQREWKSGFSNCRLVDSSSPEEIHRSAAYVCKYLTKSMLARVRASTAYGSPEPPSSVRT